MDEGLPVNKGDIIDVKKKETGAGVVILEE